MATKGCGEMQCPLNQLFVYTGSVLHAAACVLYQCCSLLWHSLFVHVRAVLFVAGLAPSLRPGWLLAAAARQQQLD
jgi:hypothetical protein